MWGSTCGAVLIHAVLCSSLEFREHNPAGAAITTIHIVQSAHFDAGCKTPRCGALRAGEPSRCARVSAVVWSTLGVNGALYRAI